MEIYAVKPEKEKSVDMTSGGYFTHIFRFVIPLIFTRILQTLYSAADMVIVGKFSGDNAMAAVGSTSSSLCLITGLFFGMAAAVGAVTARYYGARENGRLSNTAHTSVALGMWGGLLIAAVGFFISRPLIKMLNSPPEIIDMSVLYMKIRFAGMPIQLVCDLSGAVLRAMGRYKKPLLYLSFAGLVNVVLNLIFVCCIGMSVEGVALATVISQLVSMVLMLRCLAAKNEFFEFSLRKVKFYVTELKEILYLGIPAGIQSSAGTLANIMVQSAVNSVGAIAMAGYAASTSLEGFIYIFTNSFNHAMLIFTGQNYGAMNERRIKRGLAASVISVCAVGIGVGLIFCLFARPLIGCYSNDSAVIACGVTRVRYVFSFYFLQGIMDVGLAAVQGMGISVAPMVMTFLGTTGATFAATVFFGPYTVITDLNRIYISYVLGWVVTGLFHYSVFFAVIKNKIRKNVVEN